MTAITKQIESIMSDGLSRTGREIAAILGRHGFDNVRKINQLANTLTRTGRLIAQGTVSVPGSKDLIVYVINPDYVPKVRPPEAYRLGAIKGANKGNAGRLVVFRSPNEAGPGIPYTPQPAIRAQVRYGGVSSLEGF